MIKTLVSYGYNILKDLNMLAVSVSHHGLCSKLQQMQSMVFVIVLRMHIVQLCMLRLQAVMGCNFVVWEESCRVTKRSQYTKVRNDGLCFVGEIGDRG